MKGIVLNDWAQAAGINVRAVKVLRHEEQNEQTGETSWDLWLRDRATFEVHQTLYKSTRPVGDYRYVMSLLKVEPRKTVFAGVWAVSGRRCCPGGFVDPLVKEPRNYKYEFKELDFLQDYSGRMVVEWPLGRNFHRRLSKVDIRVLDIHEEGWNVQSFPGFDDFTILVSAAADLPDTWREPLKAVRGVYLLVDIKDGRQYVGSAAARDGFFERLSSYAQDGHGGNVELKRRKSRDYQFTILETVGSGATEEDILAREDAWKRKLGSRAHGLNRN